MENTQKPQKSYRKTEKDGITPFRPILRYHGGKWMLADWIISHFPAHRIYVEPFGGGASVLLKKQRTYAEIYNDLDSELVNLFRTIRDHGDDLKNRLQSASPAHDWNNYPDAVTRIIERLRGVVIENRPAIDLILAQDSVDTLFYIDPPYVKNTRTDTADDYRFEMTDLEHEELAKTLQYLDGMVIVSGYPSDLYNDIFSGWLRTEKTALADGASQRTEYLWINPACQKALEAERR